MDLEGNDFKLQKKKIQFVIAARGSASMLFKAGWGHTAPSALSEALNDP